MAEPQAIKPVRVALDAMGGDNGCQAVVTGMAKAALRHKEARFQLFGDENQLAPLLDKHKNMADRFEIIHTDSFIGMSDQPSKALKAGRSSSMRLAIDAVAAGKADCVISSGNTGAFMAMAKFVLKTVSGIHRPAIGTFTPSLHGETAFLDLGANIEADASNLLQFTVLGAAFSRAGLGTSKPSVGLLNIGTELHKGNKTLQEADLLLRERAEDLNIDYIGFIEGDDILCGNVDVVVTDGFVGNVALKAMEGSGRFILSAMRSSFRASLFSKIGAMLARDGLRTMRRRIDPRQYNGAVFLGLRGLAVKSHGNADAKGFANAISLSVDITRNEIIEKINHGVEILSKRDLLQEEAVS